MLAVASSGIASLLLPSGRTAHSRFKIPIDLHDESTCNITQQMKVAELVRKTDLIICIAREVGFGSTVGELGLGD